MAKKKQNKQSVRISPEKFLKEKANKLPIYKCLISKDYEKGGEAMTVIARERGNGKLCVGCFLVDTWCLGVKDAFGNVNMEKEEFSERFSQTPSLEETNYDFVHNLIYGAIEFAEEADIDPDRSFNTWGNILAEDTDDIPLMEMDFGKDGKHVL
ncbi:MAG: hypothetical protein K2H15_07565, partial [Muribaculaceae bacterium]|nr:hypothetical protein [Muribaculaceae bacterium]